MCPDAKNCSSPLVCRAERILRQKVMTLPDAPAARSPGLPTEFYSEGDYWWPDPACSDGPYIKYDGRSNPRCFNRHRKLLIRQSVQIATLSEAFRMTRSPKFLKKAEAILRAWFMNPNTAMRPHLSYAQAVHRRCSGRSIGVIDSIHLAETALAVRQKTFCEALDPETAATVKEWFARYLAWLTTGSFGQEERIHPNNHGTCYYLQCAAFALLTENHALLEELRHDFRERLLGFMDRRGAFPAELRRTKPYSYSLFQLNVLSGTAALLSRPEENLFLHVDRQGHSLALAASFLYPYVTDKSAWPYARDIAYWKYWPNQPAFLFLCGYFLNQPAWLRQWRHMRSDLKLFEVIRNTPIRMPRLWISHLLQEK